MARARQAYRIRGLVQAVGFRPTVWRIARAMNLAGNVYNDAAGVVATVEGDDADVAAFPERLTRSLPTEAPLARIDSIEALGLEKPLGETEFTIVESRQGAAASTIIPPDACTCDACALDMFTRSNRRWRYAFTNCTHCGPRFTITRHIPYDRPQTSMAVFPMCPECLAEYRSPADRRFHAQPNACPVCGPELSLCGPDGRPLPVDDAIAGALRRIRAGEILALKGLGGFHLVCDAANETAVRTLRRRKERDEKALAIMVANPASARLFVDLTPEEEKTLLTPAHPIVLARKRADRRGVLPGVADGFREFGVMLPYTPLHLLLFHEAAGEPEGIEWLKNGTLDLALVMTSANPSGEPLVTGNDEALRRLSSIADCYLFHNRDIVTRCDDSVVRVIDEVPRMVRRARGYTPLALPLAEECGGIVATGPALKVTACITRGREAFVTEHIGDTDNVPACEALDIAVDHFLGILEVEPKVFACDLHPDFYSTRLAVRRAGELGLPATQVQHHHAHLAAVAAELHLPLPAWGLAMDGVGLGDDGTVWGGELLRLSPDGTFERRGHLEEMALPGGDRAAREPWRMGAALCALAGMENAVAKLWPERSKMPILQLMKSQRLSPRTTALGRLFDGVSAIAGLCDVQHDEARAAMLLETAATAASGTAPMAGGWSASSGVLSLRPLMAKLITMRLAGASASEIAALFQATLCTALAGWVSATVPAGEDVILAGGCFLNRSLCTVVPALLEEQGRRAHLPKMLPPGDGGVSLGQAAVARQRFPQLWSN